jgi:4'-phosphopantetheinyl transferase
MTSVFPSAEPTGAPRSGGLPAGTVGLWLLDLADPGWDEEAAAAVLTAPERARAAAAVPSVRRRRVLMRAALRRVLGDLLDTPPRRVALDGAGSRPHLPAGDLDASCSASGWVGLLAVGRGVRIGVDVQRHRDCEARQAGEEGWLADAELRALDGLPDGERLPAVTRCWTQKEAVLKGDGVALRRAPARVVTPVAAEGWVGPWWLTGVPVPDGHVASLAVHGCPAALTGPVRLGPEAHR